MIGFVSPLVLTALVALPVIWWILRAVPPAPKRVIFGGVYLLLGLKDKEAQSDKTPWWLLLLRLSVLALLIAAAAGPYWSADAPQVRSTDHVLFVDDTWASAQHWDSMVDQTVDYLSTKVDPETRVTIVRKSEMQNRDSVTRDQAIAFLKSQRPRAYYSQGEIEISDFAQVQTDDAIVLAADPTAFVQLDLSDFQNLWRPTITGPVSGITAVEVLDDEIVIDIRHLFGPRPIGVQTVELFGPAPSGETVVLAAGEYNFDGSHITQTRIQAPQEIRNRIQWAHLSGQNHMAATYVTGSALATKEIAIFGGVSQQEQIELLSADHYIRRALEGRARVLEADLSMVLAANPDALIFTDIADIPRSDDILDWVRSGGTLIRFAGPALASSIGGDTTDTPSLAVKLRPGGRMLGGAMSWGSPREIQEFPVDGMFAGLTIPDDLRVFAQVLAQPDPFLAERVVAQLLDGTPLITRRKEGAGQVVLFHVTGNAEWSNLPLSGLFPEMLDRLISGSTLRTEAIKEIEGRWTPEIRISVTGNLIEPDTVLPLTTQDLLTSEFSDNSPAGVYSFDGLVYARNIGPALKRSNVSIWPEEIKPFDFGQAPPLDLSPWAIVLALLLLVCDVLALRAIVGRALTIGAFAICGFSLSAHDVVAEPRPIEDSENVVLAHIETGVQSVDDKVHAGLRGVSEMLFFRTSVEPGPPKMVNPALDDISVYPLLYWPVVEGAKELSEDAYIQLNAYLATGGVVLVDTMDGGLGGASQRRRLQSVLAPLNVPPIEPIPSDHVVTRSFYLLNDFPGRYANTDVWAEAAPPTDTTEDGLPFRNLNDGVSPVFIGSNDWAAAWAMDERGNELFPIGRGVTGMRQRELAYRFGINLVMHVLTGNYKSDQVHVPALLERLGDE